MKAVLRVASAMKLNPQQAPLYGECLLTVQLCEEECVEDEEDVEFYLLFAGTTQRHVSSTLKVSHVTLQAVCPAHDRSESVRVTLCQARPGGSVDPVAEECFQFVQDLALDMAQFLVNAAGKTEEALLLDECQIPLKECERLDDTLALALRHLPLPAGWSVLGTDLDTGTCTGLGIEPGPQDTLLHFAAKRGLRKVALFLLQQPGGREALRLPNKQGRTPARVAQKRGHTQLQKLLTEVENLPELETKASKWRYPEGRVLQHHPKLNTYTLTLDDVPGSPRPNLQCDVEELQRLIRSHQKEDHQPQQKPGLLILNRDSSDRTEPPNSLEPEHQESNSETCDSNSSAIEDGLCIRQNGTGDHVQSQDGEVEPCPPAVGDSGKASDKADCSQQRVEGDSVTFSAPSCGNQREEADIELCVISAEQGADKGNQEEQETCQKSLETETDNIAQSGNLESQDMGHAQSQGLLPTETSQPSQRGEEECEGSTDLSLRGDLPEEREGEMNSSQEIGLNSSAVSSRDPEDVRIELTLPTECSVERDEAKLPLNQVNSEVASSVRNDETLISDGVDKPHGSLETETGNLSEKTKGSTESVSGLVTDDANIKQNSGFSGSEGDFLESLSLRPNMAPGPVHKVRRGLSPVPETSSHEGPAVESLSETTETFQHPQEVTQPSETTLECQEILLNDSDCDTAGVSGGITAEVVSCQTDCSLPDESKEDVAPNEKMNEPKEIFEEPESIEEIKSKSNGSSLPVDSKAFIVSDLQQDVSTALSSEHCRADIIVEAPETFVQSDSTSKVVDESSQLIDSKLQTQQTDESSEPVDSEAFVVSDLQEDVSTALSSEHCEGDIIVRTPPPFGEGASETFVEPDSTSKLVDESAQLPDAKPQTQQTDESSQPVDSKAFVVSDLQEDVSTVLSSEHCEGDIIVETPAFGEKASETFVEPDSTSKLVDESAQLTDAKPQTQQTDESSQPVDSEAFVVSDLQEDLSTVLSSELCEGDIIVETPSPFGEKASETFVEPDSTSKLVDESAQLTDAKPQTQQTDESSQPVDSKAFVVSDLQEDVSTVLSSEHREADIIVETPSPFGKASETFGQLDSASELVEQILEEYSGDTANENQISEPGEPSFPTLEEEPGFKDVAPDEPLQETEIDSTSQDTISELPDPSEIAHNDCPEFNAQSQLPESSTEGANTSAEPTVECVNDLDLSCPSPLMETQGDRPSETPFTDGVKISDVIPGGGECIDMATDTCETNVSGDNLCTPMDDTSGSPLESSSMSDPLNASSSTDELTSPLDINSGLHQDLEHTSPVDIADNGLTEEPQPSETPESLNGLHQDTSDCLMERGETLQQRAEEPQVEQMTDDSTLAKDAVDGHQDSSAVIANSEAIHRETETLYAVDASRDAGIQEKKSTSVISEFPPSTPSPETVRHTESASTMRGSASDGDSLFSQDLAEDSVFNNKAEDSVTVTSGVSMTYSSSTDDTSSLGTPSAISQASTEAPTSDPCPEKPMSPGASPVSGETEEEEKKDRLTDVPERSAILRTTIRSLSPFRRHSWGPGKNSAGETEISQRSPTRGEVERRSAGHRRSMSWCPSAALRSEKDEINERSYSLEGLAAEKEGRKSLNQCMGEASQEPNCPSKLDREERGSLVSLTEEEQESDLGDCSSLDSQKSIQSGRRYVPPSQPFLTKSVSMLAISHKDLDGLASFTGTSGSLEYSISEEDPGPLRSDSEGKVGGTKVSRTFSYLKSKMSKKNKEKEKDKNKERERDAKDKERRASNGHLFTAVMPVPTIPCHQCNKPINTKDAFLCTNCNAQVHKGCRESLPVCAKVKMKQKQQQTVPDSALTPGVTLRSKTLPARERPWSAISIPDDQPAPLAPPRKSPSSIMSFNSNPLSKSMSINNIAGQMEDPPLKSLKFLSQSTDSLHKTSKVSESTESLTDEGTEMMDSQLMGEFEADAKELEADSWIFTVDKKFLKQLKKDVIKRQDVIYELIQTEMHHVRTLKIMADVYSKGLLREVQLEVQTVEKMFPMLDDVLDLHTQFFSQLLERKKESTSQEEGGFVIRKIGDLLVSQFSGSSAERMKKVYGKFCSRHNEAVNFYKELQTKDKRFQAFIKKKMSSPVVRRLSIPECILLVTQRITKYPVLLQRILQHTKENEEDHADVTQSLKLVKEVIAAVDNKVNEHEKKKRLKEVYSRTDSKSIMRMKSGQMFAREDLLRGQKLIHDGPLQLKNSAGRLKDVQALLLRDVIVFLQEKDQKYIFASLDQRSTVISLQKLIVREVANEEKGLFLITAGIEKPEMVEVYTSSKEERNTWMQLIQEAMQSILSISSREGDDDEGVPSENEEDRRLQEIKVKELRDQLHKRDEQILTLLEEKVKLFRDMCDCGVPDETGLRNRMLFRATPDDITKGEPIMKEALKEVETLQVLVNDSLGGAVQDGVCAAGPVTLPRRAETFGGFDSHQMNISKSKDGDREEMEDSAELRRTESDSVLKKASNTNPLLLLKRNNEQVLQSVAQLHDLLNTLQAVVIQQDTFIEDQRHALSDRPQPSSRHPSVSSLNSSSSSSSSRPSSLIEQEKQRSLEKQRQEVASLQKQQAAHAEERRRREKEWEARERELTQRESQLLTQEEEVQRRWKDLDEEKQDLQSKKEEYQRDLARLRDSQKRLEREREQVQREAEQIRQTEESRKNRTPSTTSEDSSKFQSTGSLDRDPSEVELSSSPSARDFLSRMDSKRKGKNLNPFSSNSSQKGQNSEAQSQIPSRLLQLAKPKEKKDKKKKKGKGQQSQTAESQSTVVPSSTLDGEIFFC
ncbi:A-kinase anchor protein 13 isoform X2 [Labeo rohita]|uniref:A-kinase anchor protein 13 isoform X2 n=1 Tax=Labeo rohita TaxID=84645 RepID=UPI0021E2B24F|nr:A-kinase anchor protein 13 isoform X2 [Labeo rohita]